MVLRTLLAPEIVAKGERKESRSIRLLGTQFIHAASMAVLPFKKLHQQKPDNLTWCS